jgi:hypothetical protein
LLSHSILYRYAVTSNNFLPGNVAFVASLKNGVNRGVAEAWARINGGGLQSSSSSASSSSSTL